MKNLVRKMNPPQENNNQNPNAEQNPNNQSSNSQNPLSEISTNKNEGMEIQQTVAVKREEMRGKKSTKQKFYSGLRRAGYYLPSERDCTLEFVRDVIGGKKKLVGMQSLIPIRNDPRFAEFSIDNILKSIQTQNDILQYLPKYTEKQRPDRNYVLNVINTLRPGTIDEMMEAAYTQRQLDQDAKKPDEILVVPEFLNLFKDPKYGLGGNGKAASMLMASYKIKKRTPRKKYQLSGDFEAAQD